MKIKHYYFFGESLNKELVSSSLDETNWDILRNSSINGAFSLENNIAEYEENCKNSTDYYQAATLINDELVKSNCNKITSFGIGKGILEWHIKNLNPNITVVCTDYTVQAINRLKQVFTNCNEAFAFDMLNDDYSIFDPESYKIMYRVSTEFDYDDWDKVFTKMFQENVNQIIYVPTEIATSKDFIREKIKHFRNILLRRKDTFCGWLYNENEYLKLWNDKYDIKKKIPFKNTAIYFLKKH